MDWDLIESNWNLYKGNIQQHWDNLTDGQLDMIAGKREHLTGKIQVMYGIEKIEAENQLSDWQANQVSSDNH